MDDGSQPERIEIELTTHDPPARRDSPVADVVVTSAEPSPDRLSWLATERGRLLAATSFAAVVALLIGVLIGGRAGSDGSSTAVSEVDATTPDTDIADIADATDPDAADATADDEPTASGVGDTATLPPPGTFETTPAPTTTGDDGSGDVLPTLPGQSAPIAVAAEVADLPIELIALQSSGDLLVVDLTTGVMVERDVARPTFAGSPTLHAGDGWVLVTDADQGRASSILDDGTVVAVGPSNGPMFVIPDSDRMWSFDFSGTSTSITEFGVDGAPTGRTIDVGSGASFGGPGVWPQQADPRGGIVVSAAGGSYSLDGESASRISTGWLIAVGQDRALAYECDDGLACSYVVIERDSGERTSIELDPVLGEGQIQTGAWGASTTAFDPDEQRLLVSVWNRFDDEPSSGIVDLRTGDYDAVSDQFVEHMRWSPDGRFVFWLSARGDVQVFDPESGESVTLSPDLEGVRAFTLRPVVAGRSR